MTGRTGLAGTLVTVGLDLFCLFSFQKASHCTYRFKKHLDARFARTLRTWKFSVWISDSELVFQTVFAIRQVCCSAIVALICRDSLDSKAKFNAPRRRASHRLSMQGIANRSPTTSRSTLDLLEVYSPLRFQYLSGSLSNRITLESFESNAYP